MSLTFGKWKVAFGTVAMLIIATMAMLSGCIDEGKDDELNIVIVTIAPQKEMVQSIVGNDVEIVVMIPENMDPHTYSPTSSQMIKVAKADIYFTLGSGIEFEETNLETLIETGSGMEIVDLSAGIDVISFDDHYGKDGHDEDDGGDDHDHDGTDGHIWLDPNNMRVMTDNVLSALEDIYPDDADMFASNHEAYVSELDLLMDDLDMMLGPFEGKKFLTYHPAWGYFGDAYKLEQISVEENGKEPGPQGVASLIEQAEENNITVVFIEPQFDTSSAEQIADAIGGEVIAVDPLSVDYMSNLRYVAEKMVQGFS